MDLDPEALTEVTKRLKRVQGQVGGIIQMVEAGRDCRDVLTQIAAASRALDRAGFKLVATGLRQCLTQEPGSTKDGPTEDEMERLFMSLA